ncbi:MAG: esterase-like activity of phytase family protein [Proteobacteria bacterium]|nr:esterase-like activity of phytase family protein [Pseudomonadota bacterium]
MGFLGASRTGANIIFSISRLGIMLKLSLLLLLLLIVSACSQHKANANLKLVKAYAVETNGVIEPSGLTMWDGEFYTVSDKHDVIYKLNFSQYNAQDNTQNQVTLTPFITIVNNRHSKLDFEGITHDEENFYLISEKHFQILKVSKDGKQQTWLASTDILKQVGISAGLFQTHNAHLEGICHIAGNDFLLAAERQPRGFMEVNVKNNTIHAYTMNQAVFTYNKNRSPDFTGLSCHDGMFVLDRNADTIAQLQKINGKFQETHGFSYKHIVNAERFKYNSMEYGLAEGLVVQDGNFYIILDNNRDYQQNNPDNNKSFFLHLTR